MVNKKILDYTWKISTFILGAITVILLAFLALGNITSTSLSKEAAGQKIVEFLNQQTGGGVTYISAKDLGDNLYEITVAYNNEMIPVYVTKDGEFFVQAAVPLSENIVQPSQPSAKATQPQQQITEAGIDDDHIFGDENAPVTIIEFSDYECPFCGRFYQQTLPQIKSNYIETGKVRLVYRDFPLSFHPNAQKAAEAAECAGEQGKYFEMHDRLFEKGVSGGVDSFKQYAAELGLNADTFNVCLDSGQMASEVQKDFADGQAAGVTGTPGFFINGKLVEGAQPFEVFAQIIEKELNSA
jgi:protein-disulfide isomerase